MCTALSFLLPSSALTCEIDDKLKLVFVFKSLMKKRANSTKDINFRTGIELRRRRCFSLCFLSGKQSVQKRSSCWIIPEEHRLTECVFTFTFVHDRGDEPLLHDVYRTAIDANVNFDGTRRISSCRQSKL